jgi:hypothetical protein
MKKIDLYISNTAPNVRGAAAWLKPTKGGCELVIIDGGEKPLVVSNNKQDTNIIDSVKNDMIGSVKDKKSANTINGAKAYANDVKKAVVGTPSDTSSDLTLNGLKAYINEQIASVE